MPLLTWRDYLTDFLCLAGGSVLGLLAGASLGHARDGFIIGNCVGLCFVLLNRFRLTQMYNVTNVKPPSVTPALGTTVLFVMLGLLIAALFLPGGTWLLLAPLCLALVLLGAWVLSHKP